MYYSVEYIVLCITPRRIIPAHRRLLAANFVCNPGKLIWGYRDSLGVPTQHFLSDPLDSFRQKVSMIKLPSLDNVSPDYMPFILRMEVESCVLMIRE